MHPCQPYSTYKENKSQKLQNIEERRKNSIPFEINSLNYKALIFFLKNLSYLPCIMYIELIIFDITFLRMTYKSIDFFLQDIV